MIRGAVGFIPTGLSSRPRGGASVRAVGRVEPGTLSASGFVSRGAPRLFGHVVWPVIPLLQRVVARCPRCMEQSYTTTSDWEHEGEESI